MKGDKITVLVATPGNPVTRFEIVAEKSGQTLVISEPQRNGPAFWTVEVLGKTQKQAAEHRFASAHVLAIIDERKALDAGG